MATATPTSTTDRKEALMATSEITPLHVERGRQMRQIVRHDVAGGLTAEAAMASLADYLGIDAEAVRLAIAVANDADSGGHVASAWNEGRL